MESSNPFEALKKLVADVEQDFYKANNGNKAAGVRTRKAMQDVKDAAQKVRTHLLETRGR